MASTAVYRSAIKSSACRSATSRYVVVPRAAENSGESGEGRVVVLVSARASQPSLFK